jgi:predicted membrane channel-forming protein YqfA (hemolysin III family)
MVWYDVDRRCLSEGIIRVKQEADMQEEFKSKRPKGSKPWHYWIAAVSYLVVLVLSTFCLVVYTPDFEGGYRNFTLTFLIGFLILGTVAFVWETIQWRKQRGSGEQESLEDVIQKMKDDANRG